ncbi:MAG: glycoside hydrolase family 2 TIM barrel-domain containing protein [Algoriphagus sp.]|uniref:glycoside hydrolase family 2 TIM barrel-domain containing protein n=1 Tax=Algoriphagus sp. TaxID=1872435 RepID=UPI002601FB93|nr:glycoside hydrolase family 2 TIM barrel-domain containing protein [Algoriphagus sp.]MDG1279638.1 glycoside hydrolase family 2 TIM barrel-domain containing protein [Algoriphagus sp.]
MKNHFFRIFLFAFTFSISINLGFAQQQSNLYQRIYLSGKDHSKAVLWDFKVSDGRNSGQWTRIKVPSNWEMEGFGTLNYGHDHRESDRVLGKEVGYYKHRFSGNPDWKGKVIRLVFDGVMTDTEVKINGQIVGPIHQGGFYRFSYDISGFLNYKKENILEVKVKKHSENESINKAEREADFWIFGGIFRPVFLEILPKTHFTRIAVDPNASGKLTTLLTLSQVPKAAQIKIELFEQGSDLAIGSKVEDISSDSVWISTQFDQIKAWNPETPNLYDARYSILQNGKTLFEKTERIGFRTVELRKNDGFYVNDVKVIFKGVNRHSSYPTTGRALSEANHLEDIFLMKEMNMNAVRMSHYVPDERFLELTDSLGLFVLDEVTGWQDAYDTIVGPKLVKETVLKDANHPSVVIWDHGNEGGWNFANEKGFHQLDIQKRPILYPWLQRNGFDTFHYPRYDAGINRLTSGQDVFLPTELLHGLYDGGLGAGLDDFWQSYTSNPLGAGGFLWVFADEAILRKDLGNIHDVDGNHAPDGIVGPYREKEGSFYTIKSIWSPVQVEPFILSPNFDGNIRVTNKYLFSNLNQTKLNWSIEAFNGWKERSEIHSGTIDLPEGKPGETRIVNLNLPSSWTSGDVLKITAIGINGEELYTWAKPIHNPTKGNQNYFRNDPPLETQNIVVRETSTDLQIAVGEKIYFFGKKYGNLQLIRVDRDLISLVQREEVEGVESTVSEVSWKRNKDGSIQIQSEYKPYPAKITWTVLTDGRLKMESSAPNFNGKNLDILGLGFSYPEEKVISAQWIGNGPYRVWQNRLKGVEFGLWEKEYNNTMTGFSFENLIYPEFKGFHSNFHALNLKTEEGEIEIRSETLGLFLGLFNPEIPPLSTPGTRPVLPKGDLSFLYKISPIGTKFHLADEMGPQGQKSNGVAHSGDTGYSMILWFDFK